MDPDGNPSHREQGHGVSHRPILPSAVIKPTCGSPDRGTSRYPWRPMTRRSACVARSRSMPSIARKEPTTHNGERRRNGCDDHGFPAESGRDQEHNSEDRAQHLAYPERETKRRPSTHDARRLSFESHGVLHECLSGDLGYRATGLRAAAMAGGRKTAPAPNAIVIGRVSNQESTISKPIPLSASRAV